jgi:hypothetical protein
MRLLVASCSGVAGKSELAFDSVLRSHPPKSNAPLRRIRCVCFMIGLAAIVAPGPFNTHTVTGVLS